MRDPIALPMVCHCVHRGAIRTLNEKCALIRIVSTIGMISTRNTIISTSKRLHGLHAIAHEIHAFAGVFSRQVVLQQARSIAQHLQELSRQ